MSTLNIILTGITRNFRFHFIHTLILRHSNTNARAKKKEMKLSSLDYKASHTYEKESRKERLIKRELLSIVFCNKNQVFFHFMIFMIFGLRRKDASERCEIVDSRTKIHQTSINTERKVKEWHSFHTYTLHTNSSTEYTKSTWNWTKK